METIKIEEGNVRKEYDNFVETDNLIIAKTPDEQGAYIAHFKTAAILKKPEDEYEREEMHQKVIKDFEKGIALIKALRP